VAPRDLEHLGIDARQDAGEHLRHQPGQVDDAAAGDRLVDALAQRAGRLVGRALDPELDVGPYVSRQLPLGHLARLVRGAREMEGRGALHDGLVQVEEGGAGHAFSCSSAPNRR